MSSHPHDLIVIGAGATGLAAAKQALQAGLSVALVEPQMFGGLITNINELHGEIAGSGADFASNLMGEVADLGGELVMCGVTALGSEGDGLAVTTAEGVRTARAVVVASGARHRKLGIPGEERFEERGVSHCADCDGPLFAGQDVVVVGGGDAALQEALVLARVCRRVHLVHRGGAFRARAEFQQAVAADDRIEVHWHSRVTELRGGQGLESLLVVDATGAASELACRAVFPFVGLEPRTEFLPSEVRRTEQGLVLTDDALATSLPGVYAAGAVRAGYGGRLSEALQEGRRAADSVAAHLSAATAAG